MELTAKEVVDIIAPFLTLGGIAFMIYRTFRDPDIKSDKNIAMIEETCKLKHTYLNRDISKMQSDLHDLKVNHIDHIEKVLLPAINEKLATIATILNERLPPKQ